MTLLHVPSKKEIGETIRRARRRKGLSQDELARLVGAKGGRHTVIGWEQGKHEPTDYRAEIAEKLDLHVGDITLDDPETDLRILAVRHQAWEAEGRELKRAIQDALARQGNDGSASG